MPCYTGPITERELNLSDSMSERQQIAVLCGIVSALGIEILDRVDWKEVGVSKELVLRWWNRHQRDDEQRKKRETNGTAKKEAEIARLEKELAALKGS